MKYTILLDLDGVLNTYRGNFNSNYIPPISNGAEDFVKSISNDYVIKIFTTRNKNLVYEWLEKYNLNKYVDEVTNIKDPAWLIIDDRCIQFDGNFTTLQKKIKKFKPWYK